MKSHTKCQPSFYNIFSYEQQQTVSKNIFVVICTRQVWSVQAHSNQFQSFAIETVMPIVFLSGPNPANFFVYFRPVRDTMTNIKNDYKWKKRRWCARDLTSASIWTSEWQAAPKNAYSVSDEIENVLLCIDHSYCNLRLFLKKNGPNPASFLFIFVLFSTQ